MTETHNITPGSLSVDGNIAGELGLLSDLDIFTPSDTELLTENQRLVNTNLEGITACSSGGCDEDGNYSLTRDTSVYKTEPGSAKLINTHVTEQLLFLILGEDGLLFVNQGKDYPITLNVQGISAAEIPVLYGVDWYDEEGELILQDYREDTIAIDSFTTLDDTFQAPGTAVTAQIIIIVAAQPDEGFYYDEGSMTGEGVDCAIDYGDDATINLVTFPVIELTES